MKWYIDMSMSIGILFLIDFLPYINFAAAFIQQVSSSSTRMRIRTQLYVAIPKHSPLEDEPWQDDDSYWDALQVASKDPATFEKFIEESIARKKGLASNNNKINGGMNDSISSDNNNKPKKKGKYVPIEEWDANRNLDDMTNEERLQWECQRNGNQYRQNEILMNNLKGF